jgi:hypothetical protein
MGITCLSSLQNVAINFTEQGCINITHLYIQKEESVLEIMGHIPLVTSS